MEDITNPLAQYFRSPGVHQILPTKGRFFGEEDIEFAMNGEVPILPMTASDEIVLKNPDALLNGDALERLFRSCVPAIKKPREISVPDMDVLLLAIKLASYGDNLEISVQCPKCKTEFVTETSIRGLLNSIKILEEKDCVIRIDENMIIYLRPYDFESKTILDLATFEETKIYQNLLDLDMTDQEKARKFNQSFERIAELNLDLLSKCILSVVIPTGEVKDPKFIREFVHKADKNLIRKIQDQIKTMSEAGINRTMSATCINQDCKHEWQTDMIFDPSHFFA